MHKILIPVALVVTMGLLGCAGKETTDAPENVNAADLWTRIDQDDPYTGYAPWPEVEGMLEGNGPHGAFIRTFVNEKAMNPTEAGYPYGSLIVKENYLPDKTLAKITVMYKVKGYDALSGDWFWAAYSPDGTVEAEGKIQPCIGCHSVRADQDHVFQRNIK